MVDNDQPEKNGLTKRAIKTNLTVTPGMGHYGTKRTLRKRVNG